MARASSLVIGTSALAVIAVAFAGFLGFRKIHSIQQRSPLRIVFEGSASGLVKGGSVNFDGVQVGEVTVAQAGKPAQDCRPGDGGKQRPDPQGHRCRPGISGADRRGGDIADRGRRRSTSGAAGRGRRSDPEGRSDRDRSRSATPCTMSTTCWSTISRPSRMRCSVSRPIPRRLASQGDAIESVLRKADTAIDGFDSTRGEDR